MGYRALPGHCEDWMSLTLIESPPADVRKLDIHKTYINSLGYRKVQNNIQVIGLHSPCTVNLTVGNVVKSQTRLA